MTTTDPNELKDVQKAVEYLSPNRVYLSVNCEPDVKFDCQALADSLSRYNEEVILLPSINNPLDFASMRNLFIDHEEVKSEWLFFLDPDERIGAYMVDYVKNVLIEQLEKTNADGANVLNVEYHKGELIHVAQTRILKRKSGLRWYGKIHETLDFLARREERKIVQSDVIIHHKGYNYLDDAQTFVKLDRNLKAMTTAMSEMFNSDKTIDIDEMLHYSKYLEQNGKNYTELLTRLNKELEKRAKK
jgi:hypothetical protein